MLPVPPPGRIAPALAIKDPACVGRSRIPEDLRGSAQLIGRNLVPLLDEFAISPGFTLSARKGLDIGEAAGMLKISTTRLRQSVREQSHGPDAKRGGRPAIAKRATAAQ